MPIGSAVGTIPLVVANGGTGAATLTGAVVGNGTSALTAGTLTVPNGGTGATSLTGIVLGNAAGAFTTDSYTATAAWPVAPAFSLATPGAPTVWTYTGTPLGRYTRLGSVVFIQAQIIWSNFSAGGGTGNWQLSLPVAAAAVAQPGQLFVSGSGIDANAETANLPANFFASIGSGASIAVLTVQEGGVANAASASFPLTVTQVKTAGTLNVSGWYFAA